MTCEGNSHPDSVIVVAAEGSGVVLSVSVVSVVTGADVVGAEVVTSRDVCQYGLTVVAELLLVFAVDDDNDDDDEEEVPLLDGSPKSSPGSSLMIVIKVFLGVGPSLLLDNRPRKATVGSKIFLDDSCGVRSSALPSKQSLNSSRIELQDTAKGRERWFRRRTMAMKALDIV